MSKHDDEYSGETKETPGMVRWYNDSHYFLKRIGTRAMITKPNTFVLGLESRFGDDAYSYSCGIEFDNDEAPDLMDRIADFNGLPKYTDLLNKVRLFQAMVDRAEKNPRKPNGEAYFDGFGDGFKAGIRAIEIILKGK